MSGFKVGDSVRVIGNTCIKHHYNIGDVVKVIDHWNDKSVRVQGTEFDAPVQIIRNHDLELIEEQDTMSHNNGDLIKVATDKDPYGAPVYTLFVKFGEFYYDLSKGGQMRGAKSIPRPARGMPKNEKIGNMSGTGDYMLGAGVDAQPLEEVADDDRPFDSHEALFDEPYVTTATGTKGSMEDWEKMNEEALKALEAFKIEYHKHF